MKPKKHNIRLFGILMALFVTGAEAATLVFYDINSNLTVAPSSVDPGLIASNMDATTASGTSTNFRRVGSHVPFWQDAAIADGTDPGVTNILVTWSLTATEGNQINISTTDALSYGVLAFSNPASTYTVSTRVFIASDASFTNILATSTILSDNAVGNGKLPLSAR
jgi:hypothetical protein